MSPSNRNEQNFSTLSLKDFVEAQGPLSLPPDEQGRTSSVARRRPLSHPRRREVAAGRRLRIRNSCVQPGRLATRTCANTPWPCIMVLVRESIEEEDFGKRDGPESLHVVRRSDDPFPMDASFPYVSCGRRRSLRSRRGHGRRFPRPNPRRSVAGCRSSSTSSADPAIATVACLVSDGHIAYALHGPTRLRRTRHGAVGAAARRYGANRRRHRQTESRARCSRKSIPPCRFGKRGSTSTSASCASTTLAAWTPSAYGLPPIKPLFDVYEQNLSLHRLMDQLGCSGRRRLRPDARHDQRRCSTAIDPWAGSTMCRTS